ncbi:GIY-YIG nuclease family protein [Curtobacterium sp. MCBD17_026]|uniref:GIY-YIG nuclease family protein n=1 Tax=Curtobacterium sp. MCBD17_026 TaxID=2175621 RepID=UPI000DA8CE32|nr:GIY-YIG nuclease family protein [Curtobacterium sp. MCBD17_026]WIB72599.1 GIY-YIG nuclease family protein [Curtobacterium sp. MCBD17_026]
MIDVLPKACYLYRFYDADDALLYVGITNDVVTRFRVHRRQSTWWTAALRCDWRVYGSRESAAAAEAAAIQLEKPRHNAIQPPVPAPAMSAAATDRADLLRALDEVARLRSEVWTERTARLLAEAECTDLRREAGVTQQVIDTLVHGRTRSDGVSS